MRKIIIWGVMVIFLLSGFARKEQAKEKFSVLAAAFDSLEANFSQFKNFLEGKDYLKAFLSLRSSLEIFWDKTPFLLHNVRFVKSGDNSFDIYNPQEGEKFTSGEPIYLYLEPIGYALKKNPKGFYEFGFTADFSLEDDSGKKCPRWGQA